MGVSSLWSVNADGSDLPRLVAGTAWGDWLSPGARRDAAGRKLSHASTASEPDQELCLGRRSGGARSPDASRLQGCWRRCR